MLSSCLLERQPTNFDFRSFASPDDPLKYLFDEWVDYYQGKYAICKAIAPKSILEIGVRFGYSAITFLKACPSARYVGLDNDSAAFGGQPGAIAWAKRITTGFDARFELVDTQRVDTLPGDHYDLVHVNGQHDGDGTYHDLELALEKGRWILVDGIFLSAESLEASTHFLRKHQALLDYAVVIPGYAGDMVIRVRDGADLRRPGSGPRDHRALREQYTRQYFLADCGGYQSFKAESGRKLVDPRLITLFEVGKPWSNQRVLDVGSGRGELSYACFAAGAEVTGLDYSDAATAIARDTYRAELGPRLDFVCADVLDYRPTAPFDRIVAADFVEHVDPATLDRILGAFSQWLAPGGRLVVHTWPNRLAYDYQHAQRRRQARALGIFVPRNQRSLYEDRMHLNEQTPAKLRRSLARHFPEPTVWVGNSDDPAAGLRRRPTRALLRAHDSIYAVASPTPVVFDGLRDALTQEALAPESLSEVSITLKHAPSQAHAGSVLEVEIELRNGSAHRLASLPPHPIHLSYHWFRGESPVVFDGLRTRLESPLEPAETRRIALRVLAPNVAGVYDLVLTLVQEGQFWLDRHSATGQVRVPGIAIL